MKLVTAAEMGRIEKQANASGLTYAQMMENAGRAVAEALAERLPVAGRRVMVLVGPGNNGGDGLVAARHLHDMGAEVRIYIWKRNTADDPNFAAVEKRGLPIVRADEDQEFQRLRQWAAEVDVIIDACLGTGLTRPLGGTLAEILDIVAGVMEERDPPPYVVAVDIPTGVNSDTGAADPATLPADLTVTFGLPKRGQFLFPGAGLVGELVVDDIDIPAEFAADVRTEVPTDDEIAALLPERPPDAHKGTFGSALVVAGSVNYTGAAYLAAAAATRVGTGLVTAAVPGPLHPIIASLLPEATYLVLPHDMGVIQADAVEVLHENLERYDALLIGPGLTQEERVAEFIAEFLLTGEQVSLRHRPIGFVPTERTPSEETLPPLPPTVIDADALNNLAKIEEWWKALRPQQAVLTPHPGEMGRLLKRPTAEVQADRIGTAQSAAQEWGQVVVLKGAHTVIAAPDGRVAVNPFATSALATAGTGDVLAGTIVGLLAQGLAPFDAAVVGCYLHGLAGEIAALDLGEAGVVAGDLLLALPLAILEVLGELDHVAFTPAEGR